MLYFLTFVPYAGYYPAKRSYNEPLTSLYRTFIESFTGSELIFSVFSILLNVFCRVVLAVYKND